MEGVLKSASLLALVIKKKKITFIIQPELANSFQKLDCPNPT